MRFALGEANPGPLPLGARLSDNGSGSKRRLRSDNMRPAEIRYASSTGGSIAYRTMGQGSLDLLLVPCLPSNLDILPEDPGYGRLVKRLSAVGRLMLFDRRGTGLSDRLDGAATAADDIAAVMEAAGSSRAVLLGASDGVAAAIRFAADHPQRVRALVLFGGYAHFHGTVMEARKLRAFVEAVENTWGSGATLSLFAPSRRDDRRFAEWWARLERLSATPGRAAALLRAAAAIDERGNLSAVQAPTLVLHRTDDAYASADGARHLAGAIAGARLVELPGRDHAMWTADVDRIADLVEEFLTGTRPIADRSRVLAVVLVARLSGDAGRSAVGAGGRLLDERLERFREAVSRAAERHGGRAEWSGADRIVAHFDSPARAAACAVVLRDTAASLGLRIAQGIHVGEIDVSLVPLAGVVLDTAARIAAAARPPEILLSRLASDLVSGSGLQFVERGTLAIEGVRDPLPVAALAAERHLEPVQRKARTVDLALLSARERQVLALVADGLSNTHIAVQLGLSEHTVKRHVANMLLKLDLPSRAAAAALVARQPAP